MSNEELAVLIKGGDAGGLPLLWDGVRGFIAKAAYSYMMGYEGSGCVELDDLVQSGYIAMVAAIDSYEPGAAKFTTWLAFHLKTAFAEATNRGTRKQRKNPLLSASSIYEPINSAGDDELLLMDTIAAPDAFEDVERKIYLEQLRSDLDIVLSTIPPDRADVLRLHFYEDKEISEIAGERGVSVEAVSADKRAGLQDMRKAVNTSRGRRLRAYVEEHTNYYSGMGLRRYTETLSSPVELKVIAREKLRGE